MPAAVRGPSLGAVDGLVYERRTMRTTLWLGVIFSTSALAACGGGRGDTVDSPIVDQPDSPPGTPDARPDADPLAPDAAPEFACHGQPIPGTAATTLTVAGDMQVLGAGGGGMAIQGATVEAYLVGNPTPVGTDTTDSAGAYSISIDNPGATPVDAYLRAPSSGNKTVYLVPPTVVYQDIPMAPIRTISDSLFPFFVTLAQANLTDGNGVIALIVTDCLNNPLTGATVTVPGQPNAQVRYNGTNGLPTGTGSASSTAADGIAYVIDMPPGPVTVDASYMGIDMREHSVNVRPANGTENAINTTTIIP
jgi:hypothetical protein